MRSELTDSGRVWVKGSFGPVHAVLVGDTVILTGVEKGQTFEGFTEGHSLFLDIIDPEREFRVARRISLMAEPTVEGTLFSGFEKTKHRDVLAIDYKKGLEDEWKAEAEEFKQTDKMNCAEFLEYVKERNS